MEEWLYAVRELNGHPIWALVALAVRASRGELLVYMGRILKLVQMRAGNWNPAKEIARALTHSSQWRSRMQS